MIRVKSSSRHFRFKAQRVNLQITTSRWPGPKLPNWLASMCQFDLMHTQVASRKFEHAKLCCGINLQEITFSMQRELSAQVEAEFNNLIFNLFASFTAKMRDFLFALFFLRNSRRFWKINSSSRFHKVISMTNEPASTRQREIKS